MFCFVLKHFSHAFLIRHTFLPEMRSSIENLNELESELTSHVFFLSLDLNFLDEDFVKKRGLRNATLKQPLQIVSSQRACLYDVLVRFGFWKSFLNSTSENNSKQSKPEVLSTFEHPVLKFWCVSRKKLTSQY
jgi:hypothetical protein